MSCVVTVSLKSFSETSNPFPFEPPRNVSQETQHNLTVNLTTLRVWCYACSKEVFLDRKLGPVTPPPGTAKPIAPAPPPGQVTPAYTPPPSLVDGATVTPLLFLASS